MKQFRLIIIGSLITLGIGVVLAIVGICLPSGYTKNIIFMIAAIFVLTFVGVLYGAYKYYIDHKDEIKNEGGLSELFKKEKELIETQNAIREKMVNLYQEASKEIGELYEKTEMLSEVGFAKFAKDGLEFEVEGKYAIVKDFKGITGNHFAFEITSIKMTNKPEDYEDVCDYESIGFRISVGYFDESPLSDYENENGVIISDISNIEGKIFELNDEAGYDFQISTVEMDGMERGQIKFLKWSDNEKTISFKFAVPWGLHDVVVGAVSLKEDKE